MMKYWRRVVSERRFWVDFCPRREFMFMFIFLLWMSERDQSAYPVCDRKMETADKAIYQVLESTAAELKCLVPPLSLDR